LGFDPVLTDKRSVSIPYSPQEAEKSEK